MYYNIIMIIDTFKTENDLKIKYSKTKHFKLKDFFITYWDKFVKFAKDKNLYIRNVVFRDGALIVVIINLLTILANLDFVII